MSFIDILNIIKTHINSEKGEIKIEDKRAKCLCFYYPKIFCKKYIKFTKFYLEKCIKELENECSKSSKSANLLLEETFELILSINNYILSDSNSLFDSYINVIKHQITMIIERKSGLELLSAVFDYLPDLLNFQKCKDIINIFENYLDCLDPSLICSCLGGISNKIKKHLSITLEENLILFQKMLMNFIINHKQIKTIKPIIDTYFINSFLNSEKDEKTGVEKTSYLRTFFIIEVISGKNNIDIAVHQIKNHQEILQKYISYAEIFKIVIDNLVKQKSKVKESTVKEIKKIIDSDAISFKYYDDYIGVYKDKILKEKDKGEFLNDFLPLIKFYEYSKDSNLYKLFLIIKDDAKMEKENKHNKEKEEKEKTNSSKNPETPPQNSITNSDKNKKESVDPFLGALGKFFILMHNHPNPFIFQLLEHLTNDRPYLDLVVKALLVDLCKQNYENKNIFLYINSIRLFQFIYLNYFDDALFNQVDNTNNINNNYKEFFSFLLNSFRFLKEKQFFSIRLCFPFFQIKNGTEILVKKTPIEFVFDSLIFFYRNNIINESDTFDYFTDFFNCYERIYQDCLLRKIDKWYDTDLWQHFSQKEIQRFYKNECCLDLVPKYSTPFYFIAKLVSLGISNDNKYDSIILLLIDYIFNLYDNGKIKEKTSFSKDELIIAVKKCIDENMKDKVKILENLKKLKINNESYPSASNLELEIVTNKERKYWLNIQSKKKDIITKKEEEEHKVYAIHKIDKTNQNKNKGFLKGKYFVLYPKSEILISSFGIVYKKRYFDNKYFYTVRNTYNNIFNGNHNTKLLNYPSTLKNFSNSQEPPLFLKQNMKFFNSKFFPITHSYLNDIKIENKVKYANKFYKAISYLTTNKEESLFPCEMIKIRHTLRGYLYINVQFMYFFSYNHVFDENSLDFAFSSQTKEEKQSEPKHTIILMSDIKEIVQKRFLYREQAFEIYLHTGRSYFFNLYSNAQLQLFLKTVGKTTKGIIIEDCVKYIEENNFLSRWKNQLLTTYELICILNKYSSRSYNDANQYFIFPWLIKNYSEIFAIKDKEHLYSKLRALEYAPSLQDQRNREKVKEKYELCEKYKFFLGSHYSTSSFLYYYQMRSSPFLENLIILQNYMLEAADRMFCSLNDTESIIRNLFDNREMIPEFYSKIEFYLNLNCSFLGVRGDGSLVDDLNISELKDQNDIKINKNELLQNYVNLLIKQRNLIKLSYIDKNISKWINLIFGVNQYNKELYNIYPKLTYPDKIDWQRKIKKYEKQENVLRAKITEKRNIILNFGQTPRRLFNSIINYSTYSRAYKLDLKNNAEFQIFGKLTKARMEQSSIDEPIIYFISDRKQSASVLLTKSRTIKVSLLAIENKRKKNRFSIQCGHFKLFKLRNSKHYRYKYCPKYSMIALNSYTVFITCRYIDNTFRMHLISFNNNLFGDNVEKRQVIIQCKSFVNSVGKIDENRFLIGLSSGQLVEYSYKKNKLKPKRSLYAHEKAITVIEYFKRLNIIITGGEDFYIYIRNERNFELLTVIQVDNYLIPYYIQINPYNLLYVMTYSLKKPTTTLFSNVSNDDSIEVKESKKGEKSREYMIRCKKEEGTEGSSVIIGYTLTGMEFARTKQLDISCFDFKVNGNIICSFYHDNTIRIYQGHSLELSLENQIKINQVNKEKYKTNLTWFQLPRDYKSYYMLYSTTSGAYGAVVMNDPDYYKFFYQTETNMQIEEESQSSQSENEVKSEHSDIMIPINNF